MKNILRVLMLILLAAIPSLAQNSVTVSGNVTDAGAVVWASGTYSFAFVGPAGASWPGGGITTPVSGNLDSSGNFSGVSIPNNNTISPSPTFWTLTVCPNANISTTYCFSNTISITKTGSLTSSITPLALSIPAVTEPEPPTAYADAEMAAPLRVGMQYFNFSTGKIRVCTVSVPCTWADVGGGGGGTVTGTGTANNVAKWTAASVLGNSTITDNGTAYTFPLGTATFGAGSTFSWLFNVTGGVADPNIGWSSSPQLSMHNVDTSNFNGFSITADWNSGTNKNFGDQFGVVAVNANFSGGPFTITSVAGTQDQPRFGSGTVNLYSSFGLAPTLNGAPPTEYRAFDAKEQNGSTAIVATTRRDFYSNLASGSGQWAFYGAGTAPSHVGGTFDSTAGYQFNGAATTAHYLRGNGTNYVDSAFVASDCATCTTNASALTLNLLVKGGGGQATQTSSITDDGTQVSTAEVVRAGNTVVVGTSNFTTASTSLVTITGLSWTLPSTAHNYAFGCRLSYSQATAAATDAFGIQAATTSPTNLYAAMRVSTGLAVTGVDATLPTLASTTATNIGTFTPSAAGTIGSVATIFVADIWGYLEQGAGATTLNIMVLTGSASDSITIYRGSSCSLLP
jgi:hypothetical protein